ncbi:MAG TPA: adventurous gliding motility lipoprotein CglC [Myxococcaceae bacterium]|nr:adventurous gliding motility lipoprotein CglC [Myxococcaceae bacterium]
MAVRRLWLFLSLLAALALPSACRVNTDLGRSCQLVKKNPDGGPTSVPIVEADLPGANKDFISFGATECEELVCVRDAYVPRTGVATAPATGYCSRSCVANSTIACPAASPADDTDPARKLSCRALLLDEQTLGAICTNDTGTCQQIGDTRSPYFCARSNPDGGTTP